MPGLESYSTQAGKQTAYDSNRMSQAPINAMKQGTQSLLQKLEEAEQRRYANRVVSAKQQAGENAIVDAGKYKKEVSKIQSDYIDNPAEMSSKLSELRNKKMFDPDTIYGRAYKDQFSSSYSNEVTQDVVEKTALAELASGGNADAFATMMDSYAKEMTTSAPTEELAAFARLKYQNAGVNGWKKFKLANNSSANKAAAKSSSDVLDQLESEYVTAMSAMDIHAMDAATAQFDKALNSAVDNGFMSKEQAGVRWKIAKEDGTVARYKVSTNDVLMRNGDVHATMSRIYRSDGFKQLPIKKQEELMTEMFSDVKAKDTMDRAKKADLKERNELHQDETYKETMKSIYIGDGSLSTINKLEVDGSLTKADANDARKVLATGSRAYSDEKTLTWYTLSDNLATTPEDELYSDSALSWKDRASLINKRKEILSSKRFKWTTTQNGKEANRRIKSHFGFEEGTFMAQIEMDNATKLAFNDMQTQMYDYISNLPEQDQDSAAIPYANQLINGYKQGLIDEKKTKAEARKLKQDEKANTAYEEYKNDWTRIWGELSEDEYKAKWLKAN